MEPWTAVVVVADVLLACATGCATTYVAIKRFHSHYANLLLVIGASTTLFILGDLLTTIATGPLLENVGITLLYSGALVCAVCWCWVSLTFADVVGRPLRAARPLKTAVATLGVATWLLVVTNPLHHAFLIPQIGTRNEYQTLWYVCFALMHGLIVGHSWVYLRELWRSDDGRMVPSVLLAAHLAFPLTSAVYSLAPWELRLDPLTLAGPASFFAFIYALFSERMFHLLPGALHEVLRRDPDGVVLVDPRGRQMFANEAATQQPDLGLGLNGEPVTFAPDLRTDDGAPLVDSLARFLSKRSGASNEEVLLADISSPDCQYELTTHPIRTRRGRLVATAMRFRDVSATAKTQQALQTSRERLRAVFNKAPVGLIACKTDRTISAANPTACELLMGGERAWTIDEELPGFAQLRDVVERCSYSGLPASAESSITTRNGVERFLKMRAERVAANQDQGARVLVLVEDFTEIQRAEQERLSFERRILETQKLESLGVLAGGVAHDFNNLLTAIRGNAELGAASVADTSRPGRHFGEILRVSRQAGEVTRQILAYTGKAPLQSELVDCNQMLHELTALVTQVRSGTQFRVRLDDDIGLVSADPGQLRQVLMNLLINAAEAQSVVGSQNEIHIDSGRHELLPDRAVSGLVGAAPAAGRYVVLRVRDAGAGMDEDTLAKIFEPFFTTKKTGRGLGLAATLGIVRAHGGFMTVESTPDLGSTFTVYLPSTCDEKRPSEPSTATEQGLERSVLFIDSNPGRHRKMVRRLEPAGCTALTAYSSEEALLLLRTLDEDVGAVLLSEACIGRDAANDAALLAECAASLLVVLREDRDERQPDWIHEHADVVLQEGDDDAVVAAIEHCGEEALAIAH